MKTYKSNLPEITLKLKKGDVLKSKITKSSDAVEVFRKVWDNDLLEICESFMVIFLNRNNTTIGWFKVSQGGLSGTIVDNRLILVTALNCLASGMIICHNHPSGNTEPSEADKKVTEKLKQAALLLDIQVIDHIILTENSFYSFADEGII